jgi:hypothetical protein
MARIVIMCSFVLMIFGCGRRIVSGSNNPGVQSNQAILSQNAQNKFSEYMLLPNIDSSFIAVLNNPNFKPGRMIENFRFFIFDMRTETIIHEDHIFLGALDWKDREHIRVKKFAGEIDSDQEQDNGYIFNVFEKNWKNL